MTYTSASQGADANPAATFMTTLNTLLVAAGFTFMEQFPLTSTAVVAASTADITPLSAPQTVDGVALVAGNRVLVKNQTTASQNGIYVVQSGAWTRATDADANGELALGFTVLVTSGTQGGQYWGVTAIGNTPWQVGVSSSTWTQTTLIGRTYKSPAVSNSFGQDWYLHVSRAQDVSTNFELSVAEVWDPVTRKFRNYAPVGGTNTPTSAFAVNDPIGIYPSSALLRRSTVALPSAGFSYFLSLHPNRVVIATRGAGSDAAAYAGLYDDLLPLAISPFPLCVVQLSASSGVGTGQGGATREPATTTSVANCFGLNANFSYGPIFNTNAIYQGSPVTARPTVYSSRVSGTNNGANGLRGTLKDAVFQTIAAAVNGDTITVTDPAGATKTYVNLSVTAANFWFDQAV